MGDVFRCVVVFGDSPHEHGPRLLSPQRGVTTSGSSGTSTRPVFGSGLTGKRPVLMERRRMFELHRKAYAAC